MSATAKAKLLNSQGAVQEVELNLGMYEAAAKQGVSLSQHLEQTFGGQVDGSKGTVMAQLCASAGIQTTYDPRNGLAPSTVKSIIEGHNDLAVADSNNDTLRGPSQGAHTPASRLLFPEVVMQLMPAYLSENNDDFISAYNQMIATTATVTSPRVEQPTIDTRAPEGSTAQAISQLSEPAKMVSITLADKSFRIPTNSIGLMISEEAMGAATIDLVALAVAAQARGQQIAMIENALKAMIMGDVDAGMSALSAVDFSTFDAASTAATPTHKAYIKWLRSEYRKRSLNWMITDIETAMKLEARAGRPTGQQWPNGTQQLNGDRGTFEAHFSVENLSVSPPRLLLVDSDVLGLDTIGALDSRFAIRRVINVSASYQAIQDFVLKRGTGFRFDFGETSHRLFDEAWSLATL